MLETQVWALLAKQETLMAPNKDAREQYEEFMTESSKHMADMVRDTVQLNGPTMTLDPIIPDLKSQASNAL